MPDKHKLINNPTDNGDQHTNHVTLNMDEQQRSGVHELNHLPNAKYIDDDHDTHSHDGIADAADNVDGRLSRIPRAIPELDEDDNDDRPYVAGSQAGIDDGFLPDAESGKPKPRRPSYAFPGYTGPGYVDIDGVQTRIPDVNAYQQKKTLAQGMMDLALLSANANQLRYVLEASDRHPYYYSSVIFISMSLIFQIAVGVGLILNGRYNIKDEKEVCHANKINNYTVIGIFIVTVVNVFISAFGVADPVSEPQH